MKTKVLTLLLALCSPLLWAAPESFSFHLFSEPVELNPQLVSSASGSYLLTNIFRGLYRYHAKKGLLLELAKKCTRPQKLRMVCVIKDTANWSDGTPVLAQHFVDAFRFLINSENKSTKAELLFSLKNAKAIWAQKKLPTELGIRALNSKTLQFDFETADPEFEFKLSHPALVPKGAPPLTNGPYGIAEWKKGKFIQLKSNKYYDTRSRPEVLIYFIDSDNTALRLYETGKLKLLRRLVASEVIRFKEHPDFIQLPMARFDYIGFGPQIQKQPLLREALSLSLDFAQFKNLFFSLGAPGCPSIPVRLMDQVPCLKYSPEKAKGLAAQLPEEDKKNRWPYAFSMLGGEDISRGAEWFQGQWHKNLDLKIELKPYEQATYLPLLANSPPAIFRKGVGLERPTCSAALEIFTSDHEENFIGLKDAAYDRLVQQTLMATDSRQQKTLCRRAVEYLLHRHLIIPLGEIHFAMLASPQFKGWSINELNQLDLTDLSYSPAP